MNRIIIYNKDRKDRSDFDCMITYSNLDNKIVYESRKYSSYLVFNPKNIKEVIKELEVFIKTYKDNTRDVYSCFSRHNILTRDEVLIIIRELNNIKDRDDSVFLNIITGNIKLKELNRKDLNKLSYKELVTVSRK